MDFKEQVKQIMDESPQCMPVICVPKIKADADISETFMHEVERVRAHAFEWQQWFVAEVCYWKQRCEELEIDLMLAKESFDLSNREQANINPKRRSVF
jgi:hypothetical protein